MRPVGGVRTVTVRGEGGTMPGLSDKKMDRIKARLAHAKWWLPHRHFKIFDPYRNRKVVQISFVDKRLANHYAVDVDRLLREIERLNGPNPLAAVSTDALLDELWGRLCPDIGPEAWRDYVNAKGTVKE